MGAEHCRPRKGAQLAMSDIIKMCKDGFSRLKSCRPHDPGLRYLKDQEQPRKATAKGRPRAACDQESDVTALMKAALQEAWPKTSHVAG